MLRQQYQVDGEAELEQLLDQIDAAVNPAMPGHPPCRAHGLAGEAELEYLLQDVEVAAYEAAVAAPPPQRVRLFTCSDADRKEIERLLRRPVTVAALRAAVEAAAGRIVTAATRAAAALEVSPRTEKTKRLFCEAFGVAPEFVPAWRATLPGMVRWTDLGQLIARRLRKAVEILDGGHIKYFCWIRPTYCPECPTDPAVPNRVDPTRTWACSSFHRYLICIGGLFWQAWQAGDTATPASTLLHEAMHIYYGTTIVHEGRSGNANCYERFVIRLNGLFLHSDTASACTAGCCGTPVALVLDQFAHNQAVLTAQHRPLLERLARQVVASWRTARPRRVICLTGHTDNTGAAPYNLTLGRQRALAVETALRASIAQQDPKVSKQIRFEVQSEGERRPATSNATAEGRSRNRRVAVVLPGS